QPPQHLAIVGDILAFRRLDDLGNLAEARVAHDAPEWLGPQRPFPNQLMTIAVRAERRPGIIEVQTTQQAGADGSLPMGPDPLVIAPQIVAGTVEVAGIETESDSLPHIIRNPLA